VPPSQTDESFLVLFFKKELLSFLNQRPGSRKCARTAAAKSWTRWRVSAKPAARRVEVRAGIEPA
jgi:hypothetical protein